MLKAVTVKEAQINRLKAEIGTADAIIVGAGAGFPPLPDLPIREAVSVNTFRILKINTASMICIPAAFILTRPRKNTGVLEPLY